MAEMESSSILTKKNILTAVFILVSIIGLFLTAKYLIPQALVLLTRAARTTTYSLSNSYIFAAPLVAPADSRTKVRVSAFLLDKQGMGVSDKVLSLSVKPKTGGGGGSVQIQSVQEKTDKYGKALFDIVSSFPGQFVTSAVIDGVEFPQTVTLTFR